MSYTALDAIRSRCDEIGDCWIWKGAVSTQGYPVTGRARKYIRRIVYELSGHKIENKLKLTTKCEDRKCVNPKCIKPETPQALAKLAYNSVVNKKKRSALIAADKQSKSPLDWERVKDIRGSDESVATLSEKHMVSKTTVYAIKRYERWKDYSSPWQGLGA